MKVEMFLTLLSFLSAINTLVVQIIKNTIGERIELPYNLVAIISGVVIGLVGCMCYYVLFDVPMDIKKAIFGLLMGFATSGCSMVGFDKIKQLIEQMRI